MDVARVEAGLILIEAEYTSARHAVAPEQQYSPYELGFEPLVDLGKATDFTGRRALRAEHAAGGPARRLVGLELDWSGIEGMYAKHGQAPAISPFVHRAPVPVYEERRQVGRATSITWGTTIKKMVGFGSVDRGHAKPGTRLERRVERRGRAGQGRRDRRAAALPRPGAQAHLARAPRNGNATRGSHSAAEALGTWRPPWIGALTPVP